MNFAEAAAVILTGGPHKGKPIGIVGITGEGLLDLDYRRRMGRDMPNREWIALETYLSTDQIRDDLAALTGGNDQ